MSDFWGLFALFFRAKGSLFLRAVFLFSVWRAKFRLRFSTADLGFKVFISSSSSIDLKSSIGNASAAFSGFLWISRDALALSESGHTSLNPNSGGLFAIEASQSGLEPGDKAYQKGPTLEPYSIPENLNCCG